jgi:hypothetical protein
METSDKTSAETEHRNHRYVGFQIPWYVHLIWVSYWVFAVYYILSYLFPALQREFVTPP